MARVELIYDLDCPNVQDARKILLEAFTEAGLQPSWTEWDRKSPESPFHVRQYGSPTILIDGRDVAGAEPAEDLDHCRLYQHGPDEMRGVPPLLSITEALGNDLASPPVQLPRSGPLWWRLLASLPGAGAAILPAGACPACWPALAAILGSVGLGFLLNSTFLSSLTIVLLGLVVFVLAFQSKRRRGYGPVVLGTLSVAIILVFKFVHAFDAIVYAGLLGLVAASSWNAWPKRKAEAGSCSRCAQQEVEKVT